MFQNLGLVVISSSLKISRNKNYPDVKDDADNETVQTENFSENEDQNHSNKEFRLLSSTPHSCNSPCLTIVLCNIMCFV